MVTIAWHLHFVNYILLFVMKILSGICREASPAGSCTAPGIRPRQGVPLIPVDVPSGSGKRFLGFHPGFVDAVLLPLVIFL